MSSVLHPRHPFTPQRSPSMPSSQASQSPPASEVEGAAVEAEQASLATLLHPAASRDDRSKANSSSQKEGNRAANNAILNCWTAHQSHGQITILFYVPRATKEQDVQVVYGSDYLIAGLKDAKELVVQARLAGRINPATSTWQLERQSNKRSRSRSRLRRKERSHDGNSDASSGGNMASTADNHTHSQKDTIEAKKTASSVTSSEASSFDMLSRSTDTFDTDSSQWRQTTSAGPDSPAAHHLEQSITLSEESGYAHSGSSSGSGSGSGSGSVSGEERGGVQSLESSMSFDVSHQSSNSRPRSEDDLVTDAKLVTLHLDKVDGGIWPFLVSGPASSSLLSEDRLRDIATGASRQQSLSAALLEVLGRPPDAPLSADAAGDAAVGEKEEVEDDLDNSFTHSTTTVDTISSDDSTTVLGARPSSDEALFEMDPTSLALMGIRHAKQGHQSPFGSISAQEGSQAFEYFKRAWRRGEIPLATKRLVEDYLPLAAHQSDVLLLPFRSRMIASLGGPTALARLYVSYARLLLPSCDERRSPLAFPLGGLSNPFGGGHGGHDHHSSPRSQAESTLGPEPLTYLREARLLDNNVAITPIEWREAEEVEFASRRDIKDDAWRSEREDGLFAASESDQASRGQPQKESVKRRKKAKGLKRKGAKSTASSSTTSSRLPREDRAKNADSFASDQGLVFLFVSRAALLSVMVAGGVAVAGWWRRAAAAGGGSS